MSPRVANLITVALLGLAFVGFLFPRLWPAKCPARLRCVSVGFLLLGLFALLSRFTVTIWDGGYSRAEFEITFQDANRQPVEGVQLRVEDRQGHTFYHYPVTDYLPNHIPTSDSEGLMVFHHAGGGIEFSGRCCFLFGWLPVQEHAGPEYICRFLYRGQEVYRVRYSDLNSWRRGTWDKTEKRKSTWKRPEWPASQLLPKEDESDDAHHARIRKLFDLDGDGELNAEEGAAYQAETDWRNEAAAIARLKGEDPVEEMEIPVVRRTVTIHLKPE